MNELTTINQTPNYAALIRMSNKAASTKRNYERAITQALSNGVDLSNATDLRTYAAELPNSQRLQLRAAIKLLVGDAAFFLKAGATAENVQQVQANLLNLEALGDAIQTKAAKVRRKHNWLTADQLKGMLAHCSDDWRGRRDRLALLLMGDCGFRRAEAAEVQYTDITRHGERLHLYTVGKGAKSREVPLHPETYRLMMVFKNEHDGRYVLKSISRHGYVSDGISDRALTDIVKRYGRLIGIEDLAPHDLRRSFAEIRKQAGVNIVTIQKWLGHENLDTTRRYLSDDVPDNDYVDVLKL